MVDHDVNNIREAFGSVQAGLSALNAEIRALSDQIDAAQYVSSDAAAQLCAALQNYGAQADHLERLGAELLVPIGGGMAGISEAIRAFEASRSNARMRETLRDYFRLTAAAARTRSALEESKQKLMEKCALCGDRLGEEITPYAMAVDYVRGDEESLSDECYGAIEAALGPALASSVDNRNVRYDETLSTAAYFDGSCPLLTPPDGDDAQGGPDGGTLGGSNGGVQGGSDGGTQGGSNGGTQGDSNGDGAQGDLDGDGAQGSHAGLLNGYGGLIEGASIEFAGNAPASGLQMSAFRLAAAKRKDIPDMLRWLAEEKLHALDQADSPLCRCPSYRETIEYLAEQGYVTRLKIESNLLCGEYTALTDKGWACFTRTDVQLFIKNECSRSQIYTHAKAPLPRAVLMTASALTAGDAVRLALIHEFFVRTRQNAVLFTPPGGVVFGAALAEHSTIAIPAVFDADGDAERALEALLAMLADYAAEERLALIVARRQDALLLARSFDLPQRAFSVVEDDYAVYRIEDGRLVPDDTFAIMPPHPDNDGASVQNPPPGEEGAFAAALKKHGAFLSEAVQLEPLTVEKNDAEEKEVTSSVFKSELRRVYENANKSIVKTIADRGCASRAFITACSKMPADIADAALSYLCRKGYLRRCALSDAGEFFCASPRLERALRFSDASRYIGAHKLEDDKALFQPESSECAAAALAQLAIERAARVRLTQRGVHDSSVSSSLAHCCTATRLSVTRGAARTELLLSAVWRDDGECGFFLTAVEELLRPLKTVDQLTIAALTTDSARALADALFEAGTQCEKCPTVLLYGLREDAFTPYRTPPEDNPPEDNPPEDNPPEDNPPEDNPPEDTHDSAPIEAPDALFPDDLFNDNDDLFNDNDDLFTGDSAPVETPEGSAPGDVTRPFMAGDAADMLKAACEMLMQGSFHAAAAYLRVNLEATPALQPPYNLIAYALNDPLAHCVYQTSAIFPMLSGRSAFEDTLIIAIALRTFYSNQNGYDFDVRPFYDTIRDYPPLSRYPALNRAVYELMSFKADQKRGMEAYAGYRLKSRTQLEDKISALRREAALFYDSFIAGTIRENARQQRFLETKKAIFATDGDLGQCMKAVVDDARDELPLVRGYLEQHFCKSGAPIAPEAIDGDMLWRYIVSFWEKAGEKLTFKKNEDLKSRLRSNITSSVTKGVQLLCEWCALLSLVSGTAQDEGDAAYRRARRPVEEALGEALDEIAADTRARTLEESAALSALTATLKELRACMSDEFSDRAHAYFYAPFLQTDDVMLCDDFTPDFDMHSTALAALAPAARILSHARKLAGGAQSYQKRLREIMTEGGDDYGAARLIVRYIAASDPAAELPYSDKDIGDSIFYARDAAGQSKDDFVGELELAQSYGQIDNSGVNRTERILAAVDSWYDWALESCNFGFFRNVMDAYLDDIRASAKLRESDLTRRLDLMRETAVPGVSPEVKEKRLQKIARAIQEQKYTVAEDLLGRFSSVEDDAETILDEDFLSDFLNNYEDFYRTVSPRGALEALLSRRARNKEERGGLQLVQNWLPGGSNLGAGKLISLLDSLGIRDVAAKLDSVGRYESYVVSATPQAKAQRHTLTHPIAAFGSSIWQNGFRVVCVNGAYDADMLIDVMKQIGSAYHTLILLDHALQLPERRRLAFKVKNTAEDKMFCVIDRVAMAFLTRNYDETKILRMLMAIVAPFSFYQPYVWESANFMPPELFMGRRSELEAIKAANGVNIVYGGRQLGKSALLKRARDDVDGSVIKDAGAGTDCHQRAIYIDVRELDYKKTARRISQELYDQGILDQDIDTDSWDELSRAVRNRLRQSGPNRIPYLLLLLDEADVFIESCADVNYLPFDRLKEMQSFEANRFKFVVAGLRNVVRFNRAALDRNSVLPHMQSLTVTPFSVSEARELLEVPLYYLGLRFPHDRESLITLILATTNYFPGLIQLYCARLLEAMRRNDYAGYDETRSPAYVVSVHHIKKVLADPEFNQQIWDKYYITLKLAEDDYYYVIALLMAYLYRERDSVAGHSAKDIRALSAELNIRRICEMPVEKLSALMEELIELNVLRRSDPTHYLFARYTFFQMMAARIDIEDELLKYMEA